MCQGKGKVFQSSVFDECVGGWTLQVCMSVRVPVHVEVRGQPGVLFKQTLSTLLEIGSLMGLELTSNILD